MSISLESAADDVLLKILTVCKEDEHKAFEVLRERHYPAIRNELLSWGADQLLADWISREVFHRMWDDRIELAGKGEIIMSARAESRVIFQKFIQVMLSN